MLKDEQEFTRVAVWGIGLRQEGARMLGRKGYGCSTKGGEGAQKVPQRGQKVAMGLFRPGR